MMISLVATHKYTTKSIIILPLSFESIRQPLLQHHFRYNSFSMSVLTNLAVVILLNWLLDLLAVWPWNWLNVSGTCHTHGTVHHQQECNCKRRSIMKSLWLALGPSICMLSTLGGVLLVVIATHMIYRASSETDGALGNVTFPLLYLIIGSLRMSGIWISSQWVKSAAKPLKADKPRQQQQQLQPQQLQQLPDDSRLNQIESHYLDLKQEMATILENQRSTPLITSTPTSPEFTELLQNINTNMTRLLEKNDSFDPATPNSVYDDYQGSNLDEELVSVPLFPFSSLMTSPAIRDKRDSYLTDDDTVFEGMSNGDSPSNETTPIDLMFEPWSSGNKLHDFDHNITTAHDDDDDDDDDDEEDEEDDDDDPKPSQRMYSLHGLPLTSSIKRLITRNTNRVSIKDFQMSDVSSDSYVLSKDERLTEILLFFINSCMHQVTMSKFLNDPYGVLKHVFIEVKPHVNNYYHRKLATYTTFTMLIKRVIFEYFYHHIITKSISPIDTIFKIHRFCMRLIWKFTYPLFMIFIVFPWNILRVYVSIMCFIPRALFRVVIMLPLFGFCESRRVRSKLSNSTEPDKEFQGIKKFRLSSTNRIHQVKTRRLPIENLTKRYHREHDHDEEFSRQSERRSEPVRLAFKN